MSDRRTVLVAGATGSIGGGAAVALAKRGAQVVVLGRKPDRSEARASAIREALVEEGPQDGTVETLVIDFCDMDSVRSAAADALDRYPAMDGLVLSVGLLAQDGPRVEALEWRHIGPFNGGRGTSVVGHPTDPFVFYFGHSSGGLWKTDDAGESWQELDTGTVAMLTDGLRLDDGTIVIVGLAGAVLTSSDDGNTFELHPQANRRGISAVVDVGDGSLILVGEFGVKISTLDQLIAGES